MTTKNGLVRDEKEWTKKNGLVKDDKKWTGKGLKGKQRACP